jgi:hypothetical protein
MFQWSQVLAITIFAHKQPNHLKHLLSGLYNLPNGIFHLLVSSPGDPRGVRCSHFLVRILPAITFFSVDQNQHQGPIGA